MPAIMLSTLPIILLITKIVLIKIRKDLMLLCKIMLVNIYFQSFKIMKSLGGENT